MSSPRPNHCSFDRLPRRSGFLLLTLMLWAAAWGTAAASDTTWHHDLTVRLAPETRQLAAEDTITIRGRGVVEFALGPRFTVEHLDLDGQPVGLVTQGEGEPMHHWRVDLGPSPRAGRVTVRYHGRLEPLPEADERGVLGGPPPMAGSRGSFLPGNAGWYPESAETTFTYRVSVDLPVNQRGVVPGRLVSEREGEGRYQATFEFDHPAESITVVAGPYQVRERWLPRSGAPAIRLRTYFHPEIADLAPEYLSAVGGYIELYSHWIGEYPFTEFSVVSSPLPTGFGMPTLTYLGVDVLRLPFIRTTSLGHEILHNWWGNGVYVDWASGNWSEGLTTFMADYTFKEREGADAARQMRLGWLRDFASVPADQDIPLRQFTARTHETLQIVGYDKGAFLFLMLRDRIGRQAFDAGLRNFWRDQQFRQASWADLERAFEQGSGQDLAPFFDQWLSRRGAPTLRIERAGLEQLPSGTRIRATLVLGEPAYRLRVPVVVATVSGSEPHVLDVARGQRDFVLQVGARPLSLLIDPDFRLFRRLEPGEVPPILRQVIVDPRTVTIVPGQDVTAREAAMQLARRLLDYPPKFAEEDRLPGEAPLLVIGLPTDVDAFLSRQRLPKRPEDLGGKGTAQVWAAYRADGKTLAVVSGENAEALLALLRPLPHYGRQSYLIFDGAKAIDQGVWPARSPEWRFTQA
ncbi:MAG: M1 family metallopeptidase, partial [Candidatus Methylomirabilales bacterium]